MPVVVASIGSTIDALSMLAIIAFVVILLVGIFGHTKTDPPTTREYTGPTLITCYVCEGNVSSEAFRCPHCGQPLRT